MIYLCDKTLDLYRGRGTCEFCFRPCRVRHPHHIFGRGVGGGKRLDLRITLASLGHDFECPCHRGYHDRADPSKEELLCIVGRREHCTPEAIEDVVALILRVPKDASVERIEGELAGLDRLARTLGKRTFREMGIRWRATK